MTIYKPFFILVCVLPRLFCLHFDVNIDKSFYTFPKSDEIKKAEAEASI